MAPKSKVVKVRTECKSCGKICGFQHGMPGRNQAIPTLHVMACLDDLLIVTPPPSLPPLSFGLCCQTPPQTGIEEVRDLLALSTGTTPCMQPGSIPDPKEAINEQLESKCCCVLQ